MNRSNLIEKISNKYKDLDNELIKNIIDSIFSFLSESLAREERIEIRKLGAFSIRKRKNSESKSDLKVIYFRHSKILK